jgi:hypothetical protein
MGAIKVIDTNREAVHFEIKMSMDALTSDTLTIAQLITILG